MRITLIISLFTLIMFSCQDEPKQNGTINIPDPTDVEIPAVPKIDKTKINTKPVHRLVLDNPKFLEVGIKQMEGDKVYQNSKDGYNTIIISERDKLGYTIEGKEKEFEIPKGAINVLINPSKLDYYLEEIVFIDNKRSDEGPFETKDITIPRINGEGIVMGPFKLIKGQEIITGFDLAPSDPVPEEIASPRNQSIKRFYKLQRYWAEGWDKK